MAVPIFSRIARLFHEGAFFKACRTGNLHQVKRLLAENPERVRQTTPSGYTGLMLAAATGQAKVVRFLLEAAPEEINRQDEKKRGTALLYAVTSGSPATVRVLCEAGANPNIANCKDITPLHMAVFDGQPDIAFLLIEHEAYPLSPDANGRTAIDLMRQSTLHSFRKLAEAHEQGVQEQNNSDDADLVYP
ncbi:MAG: ankyrin repeat domain-containing protein [Desulfobulbus sp.]|jgi:ankyrin repeat protein